MSSMLSAVSPNSISSQAYARNPACDCCSVILHSLHDIHAVVVIYRNVPRDSVLTALGCLNRRRYAVLAGRIENVAVAGVDVVAAACGALMEGMATAEASLAATKSEAKVCPTP